MAAVLLVDASDEIRSRVRSVDARLASGELREATLVRITANMVKRAMSVGDREGVESSTDMAGPYHRTLSFANPQANLYMSAADLRALSPGRRAFSVDL